MDKIAKIFVQLIRYLSIVAVGYLFLQGLFTICTIQHVTERTFYVENNVFYALFGIGIAALLMVVVWKYCTRFCVKYEKLFVYAGIALSSMFLIWWMGQTQFWYWGDEEEVFQYAQMYLMGDYSGWMPGGYPYMWPHQNGMILFVALLLKFFEVSQVDVIFRGLNILFYELTLLFMWMTLRKLFPDARIIVVQMSMLFLFFPYGFYCVMYYGNVIGLGFGVIAVYCAIVYLEAYKIRHLVGCGLAMVCSIIFKQNDLIILVGILLLLIMQLMGKKEFTLKRGGLIIVFAIAVCMGMQVPNLIVEAQTGIDLSEAGNSKYAHIAMGLQDSEDAPGWYNTYNEYIFAENGYNKEETARKAKENLVQTLQYYAENPMEGWSFINRKMASQWNNPTFEGFHMQNARNTSGELSSLVKSVINDGGKANILLTLFLDVFESVVLFGVLLFLVAQKDGVREYLFATLFVGAFVFFAVWEAKGRYVAPFFFMIVPYAAVGYQKLYRGGRRFDITKKAILVLAVLVLIIGLSDSPILNNSMKLGNQSEEYYQYIHEYNHNFEKLRF